MLEGHRKITQMDYTTAEKQITFAEHGLREKRPLLEHDGRIAGELLEGKNCRTSSAQEVPSVPAPSMQGYTSLVDNDETGTSEPILYLYSGAVDP